MFTIPLLFQLATAAAPLPPRDSAALLDRVKEAGFWFVMRWRWQVQYDLRFPAVIDSGGKQRTVRKGRSNAQAPAVIREAVLPDTAGGWLPPSGLVPLTITFGLGGPLGSCDPEGGRPNDTDMHAMQAHLIRGSGLHMSLCPTFRGPPRGDDPARVDLGLTQEGLDSIRVLRRNYIEGLDSAARRIPGDGWITGQRVRFNLDANNVQAAQRAADECRAERWWCTALAAYVRYSVGDDETAERMFTRAHQLMPLEVRCEWDDLTLLLPRAERPLYEGLPCARRDSVNRVAWWLADPLFVQNGNDRHAEQMARQVIVALHSALDVDLWHDWRPSYQGPALREDILRFGQFKWVTNDPYLWPGAEFEHRAENEPHSAFWADPKDSTYRELRKGRVDLKRAYQFNRFDSRTLFLGVKGDASHGGPGFHMLPTMRAILDPMSVGPTDWDLAPGTGPCGDGLTPFDIRWRRDNCGKTWDGTWWASEFFNHRDGAIVPVESQVGFFRREKNPVLAAAVQWDSTGYPWKLPQNRVVLAATAMKGPDAPRVSASSTIAATDPLSLAATMLPGHSVLSLEIVPSGESGTAGRARMGIDAPAPLSVLGAGDIAISDPMLVRAGPGDKPPADAEAMLDRMLGSTTLRNPQTLGVFWEVYGLADRDTVDVAVRVVRRDDAGTLRRVGASVGLGRVGDDSLTIRWKEPRADDPAATTDGAVTIRPRGLVLNVASLGAGSYFIEIAVTRGTTTARSRREMTIAR